MFCAAWTVLLVAFQLVSGNILAERAFLGYVPVTVEVVALLSWIAGWIAVAVDIGTGACLERFSSCRALKVLTVFGAIQWMLFMGTTARVFSLFLEGKQQPRTLIS